MYPALMLLSLKIELLSFVKLNERWKKFTKRLAVHSPEINLQKPLLLTSHSTNASLQIPFNLLLLNGLNLFLAAHPPCLEPSP